MTQKGNHTWDIIIHYHRCPQCGYIQESRKDYDYRMGAYLKDVTCTKCQLKYTVNKAAKPTFGPLIGHPQPTEVDWRT